MTYITTPPADPVEGNPGHFAHTLWVKGALIALDAGLVALADDVTDLSATTATNTSGISSINTVLGSTPQGSYGTVAARLTAIEALAGSGGAWPNTVYATTANFSGIDPTGTSDSGAGLTAAFNAVPDRGTLLIPPGTYLYSTVLTWQNKNVRIIAYGAKFLRTAATGAIVLQGSMGTTYTISSITEAIDTSFARGEQLPVTTLVLGSTPSGWVVGDYVKVAADDWAPPTTNIRAGQVMQVISISGTTVKLAGYLRDNYTTNPRVARMPGGAAAPYKVIWEGGEFRDNDTLLASGTMAYAALQASRLVDPEIFGVRFTALTSPGLYLGHTYRARASITADRLLDGGSVYGYGCDDGGEFTVATVWANRIRHAYTTGPNQAGAGGNVGDMGRVYGSKVYGIAIGASQVAWDVHGDADNVTFIDCSAINCYYGFQLRGINNKIIGGRIDGPCYPGAVVVSTSDTSDTHTYGHYVGGGLVIENILGPAFALSSQSDETSYPATVLADLTIINRDTSKYIIDTGVPVQYVPGAIRVPAGGTRQRITGTGSISAAATYSYP